MAITVPVAGQEISASTFGIPVANEVNVLTPLVPAINKPPGRQWRNALGAANGTAGFIVVPGSTTIPTETGARKWLIVVSLHVDNSGTGFPKPGYAYLYINGAGVDQYALYQGMPNQTLMCVFAVTTPTAITSSSLQISSMVHSATGGFMTFIDGGP